MGTGDVYTRGRYRDSWSAWAGTFNDIIDVADVLERQYEPLKEHAISGAGRPDPDAQEYEKKRHADYVRSLEKQARVRTKVTLKGKAAHEITGSPASAVLNGQLYPSQVAEIELEIGNYGSALPLTTTAWQAGRFGSACRLRIDSGDPDWVDITARKADAAIRKGVPNWAWVRTGRGLLALLLAATLIAATQLVVLFAHGPVAVSWAFSGLSVFISAVYEVTIWWVPAAQFLKDGESPVGSRLFVWAGRVVGALVLAVIGGLLVTAIAAQPSPAKPPSPTTTTSVPGHR